MLYIHFSRAESNQHKIDEKHKSIFNIQLILFWNKQTKNLSGVWYWHFCDIDIDIADTVGGSSRRAHADCCSSHRRHFRGECSHIVYIGKKSIQ